MSGTAEPWSQTLKRWFRRAGLMVAAYFALVFIGIALVIGADIVRHNRAQQELVQAFNALNHPEQTRRLDAVRSIGVMVGSGNHCDSLLAELRAAPPGTTGATIREQYGIRPTGARGAQLVFPGETEAGTAAFYEMPAKIQDLTAQAWGWDSAETVYIVYSVHFMFVERGFDVRCS